jgi:hypothetical protein
MKGQKVWINNSGIQFMNLKIIIFRFILLSGFLAVLFIFGWVYNRKILKEKELYLLLPLSVIIGISSYTLLLNLLSYLLSITISFYLTLVVLIILSFLICLVFPGKIVGEIELHLSKKAKLILALSLITILGIGAFLDMGIVIFYEEFSRAFIATIARGNFPVKYPWAPDFAAQYHYGPLLFGAAVHKISGFEVYWVFDILIFILTGVAFLMVFGLIQHYTRNTTAAFLSTLFFFFSGWLMWVKLFSNLAYVPLPSTPFLHISDSSLWRYIAAFCIRLSYLPPSDIFSLGELYGFMYQKNHLPSLFGFPTFLCLVYLVLKEPVLRNSRSDYNYIALSITLMIILPFLALVDESKFGLFLLTLPLYFIIELILFKHLDLRLLFFISLILLASLILALFQGGYLPQFIFGSKDITANSTLVTLSSLRLRARFGIPFADSFIPLGSSGWLTLYVRYFGIYFLTGPIILYFVYRKKIKLGIFLTLVGIIGFTLPQVISFPVIEQSLVRITHVYTLFFGMVLGIILGDLIESSHNSLMSKTTWIVSWFIIIVTSGSTLLFLARLVETKPVYYREVPLLDKEAGLWMRKNLPDKSRILAKKYYLIPQLTGLFAPAMISRYSLDENYIKALKDLDLESLQKLKIDYVYLTKAQYEAFSEKTKALLKDPTYFKEIFCLSSQAPMDDWRKVFLLHHGRSSQNKY